MPLSSEAVYWDGVANRSVGLADDGLVTYADNVWKRPAQIRNLLKYDFIDQKVLEIGVGNCVIAATMHSLLRGVMEYKGTDISDFFIKFGKKVYGIDIEKADVKELPGSGYTRIIAFDVLEHVRPEDRPAGYKRIFDVAADGALLFLHFSYGESFHDKTFDHPFGTQDLLALERAGFTLESYERFICPHPKGAIPYVFAVMSK